MQMVKKKRAEAHRWTREEDLRLLTLRAEGKSYAEISPLMGLNVGQLTGRTSTLKVEPLLRPYLAELKREISETTS